MNDHDKRYYTALFPALAFLGAVILGTLNPWMLAGAENNCAAVEQRMASAITAGETNAAAQVLTHGIFKLTNGRMVASLVANHWRHTPVPIGCAYVYWLGPDGPLSREAKTK